FIYYDWMIRDFFLYLSNLDENQEYWLAPGSNQRVNRKGSFNYKARQAYNRALDAIVYEDKDMPNCANGEWREIFGSKFTG
ncbi:MAG: nucleotidyltransferase, partial [Candidatus Gracilibacteria bacterium]|nr:nucleotidyltransferase [Candidatus Gracilibacteria bacterium]